MTLRLVGAGVGRTGTLSLKAALEQLLGGPCHHMLEVFGHPEQIPVWTAAAQGEAVDWAALMDGYEAAVDWPTGAFWPELSAAFPDAVILLSTRSSAEVWYRSASDTIFQGVTQPVDTDDAGAVAFRGMWDALAANRFTPDVSDAEAAMAAYEAHNARVRAEADPSRLVEWQPGDGWEPLCAALGVPVPDEEFPHHNTTEEFRARFRDGV